MITSRTAIAALALVLPWLLTACETRRLSEIQTQFNQLVVARAACSGRTDEVVAKAPRDGAREALAPADWNCLEDPAPGFQEIARSAREVGERATSPADRVAALRLAAMAAWQADARGPLDDARAAASLCDEKPAAGGDVASRPGPRDCALVRLIPGLVALDAASRRLAELDREVAIFPVPPQEPQRSQVQARHLAGYLGALDRYDAIAAGAFEAAAREALATPDLPPEFARYVERQRLIGACAYRKAANRIVPLSGRRPTSIPAADLPRHCPADRESLALEPLMRGAWERARESLVPLAREDHRAQCGLMHLRAEILRQTGLDFDTVDCGR
jgi:hypothetical protein